MCEYGWTKSWQLWNHSDTPTRWDFLPVTWQYFCVFTAFHPHRWESQPETSGMLPHRRCSSWTSKSKAAITLLCFSGWSVIMCTCRLPESLCVCVSCFHQHFKDFCEMGTELLWQKILNDAWGLCQVCQLDNRWVIPEKDCDYSLSAWANNNPPWGCFSGSNRSSTSGAATDGHHITLTPSCFDEYYTTLQNF